MKRFYIIGFLILMSFDTLSQISFKYASTQALPLELSPDWLMRLFLNPWLYGAIAGYLGAFVTWMTLLRYAPVGPSFAASHLELISVTLFSVWLFNEPLNAYKILGGVLILLGVLCLAKDEKDDEAGEAETAVAVLSRAVCRMRSMESVGAAVRERETALYRVLTRLGAKAVREAREK